MDNNFKLTNVKTIAQVEHETITEIFRTKCPDGLRKDLWV